MHTNPTANLTVDAKMPFLEQALDPRVAQEKLQTLLGIPSSTALKSARLLRHKLGRRCLIEYAFTSPQNDDEPVVILGKARARGVDYASFQCQQALWNAGFDATSPDHISVPEPLGVIPEWSMWFQPKIPGMSAFQRLEAAEGVPLAGQIGQALAKLHQTDLSSQRQHTLADELQILHERLPRLLATHPHWDTRLERLLKCCDRLADRIPLPSRHVGMHRDFYPDQVLVNPEGRLYLLDFDLHCMGDPALDIGNFVAHLIEYGLRTAGDPEHLRLQAMVFIEQAVLHARQPVSQFAIEVYVWLTLVRHIYISSLFPDRQPFTESLLQLCEESKIAHV
jgi:hypothetical protein